MGVWIETSQSSANDANVESHPAWVCGLKLMSYVMLLIMVLSHPAWVCGLKHLVKQWFNIVRKVTPCVGVWIETFLDNFLYPL